MFRIVEIEDVVKVHPSKFGKETKRFIEETLKENFVDKIENKVGFILSILNVKSISKGKIYPADPYIYYKVVFEALTYMPELNEIVYGEVVENTNFGTFVNSICNDIFVHISQTMDDFVSFNQKNKTLVGKDSKRVLKEKDYVRVRIVSVSLSENNVKVSGTMRQAFLGSLSWIEEERKKHAKKS